MCEYVCRIETALSVNRAVIHCFMSWGNRRVYRLLEKCFYPLYGLPASTRPTVSNWI